MKKVLDVIVTIIVYPIIIIWKIYKYFTKKETLFVTFGQMLALFPGKIGIYLRRAYYRATLQKCGRNANIGFGTFFSHPSSEIGDNVYIGSGCIIGKSSIGSGSMIGSNVDILSGKHQHRRDDSGRLLGSEQGRFERIHIGSNSWIGNRSVIIANIGDRCTVGAGSVVPKVVGDDQIVVGNPARRIAAAPGSLVHKI